MGFNCGIVGLPNVGKSTLFNALTSTQAAEAANYPFCTIEPNIGRVAVPDPRLDTLAAIGPSAKIIATQLEFVDIAGLVRGASKGEGLGNQFLARIREMDAIVHVLRCFEDDDITHVEGTVDPLRDAEIISTELMLADLDSLERRLTAARKKARSDDHDARVAVELMERAQAMLASGHPAREVTVEPSMTGIWNQLQLITARPVLYIANVAEDDAATGNALSARLGEWARKEGTEAIIISAAIESEIARLPADEKAEFLGAIGLQEAGLNKIIRAGYTLLDLLTFFTVGPKEARAWTVRRGARAPEAAGAIHTDFERGFIRAETIAYEDFVSLGGEAGAREAGPDAPRREGLYRGRRRRAPLQI